MNNEELMTTGIDFSDRQFDKFMHAFKHTCGVTLRLKNNQLMANNGHPVPITLDQGYKILKAKVKGKGVLLQMTPYLMYMQAFAD